MREVEGQLELTANFSCLGIARGRAAGRGRRAAGRGGRAGGGRGRAQEQRQAQWQAKRQTQVSEDRGPASRCRVEGGRGG